jgi:DNA transformation protein and related proteins
MADRRSIDFKTTHDALADDVDVGSLIGIGPKSVVLLRSVGVRTRGDLRRVGVVQTFLRARGVSNGVSLNLLWALEGALTDLHWTFISPARRSQLRDELGRSE